MVIEILFGEFVEPPEAKECEADAAGDAAKRNILKAERIKNPIVREDHKAAIAVDAQSSIFPCLPYIC
eukprot:5023760-Amphidinium_carterae.1